MKAFAATADLRFMQAACEQTIHFRSKIVTKAHYVANGNTPPRFAWDKTLSRRRS